MDRKKVIGVLNKLKKNHPDQMLIVETPGGTVEVRLGDVIIYEGMDREIVIDSE